VAQGLGPEFKLQYHKKKVFVEMQGVVMHTYNLTILEVETRGSQVPD
jgi:hypothetical protein